MPTDVYNEQPDSQRLVLSRSCLASRVQHGQQLRVRRGSAARNPGRWFVVPFLARNYAYDFQLLRRWCLSYSDMTFFSDFLVMNFRFAEREVLFQLELRTLRKCLRRFFLIWPFDFKSALVVFLCHFGRWSRCQNADCHGACHPKERSSWNGDVPWSKESKRQTVESFRSFRLKLQILCAFHFCGVLPSCRFFSGQLCSKLPVCELGPDSNYSDYSLYFWYWCIDVQSLP